MHVTQLGECNPVQGVDGDQLVVGGELVQEYLGHRMIGVQLVGKGLGQGVDGDKGVEGGQGHWVDESQEVERSQREVGNRLVAEAQPGCMDVVGALVDFGNSVGWITSGKDNTLVRCSN